LCLIFGHGNSRRILKYWPSASRQPIDKSFASHSLSPERSFREAVIHAAGTPLAKTGVQLRTFKASACTHF
jgi:hypothetical protein